MLMTFNIFCRCHSSYIANHLRYKCCNDLNIYEKNELESTFTENANPKKSIVIVGVMYRHPSMDLTDFNISQLKELFENISEKQKYIFLHGNFNVNLLKYNEHNQTDEFLDCLAFTLIFQPTRITTIVILLEIMYFQMLLIQA